MTMTIPGQDVSTMLNTHGAAMQMVRRMQAELAHARLSGTPAQISAAEDNLGFAEAQLRESAYRAHAAMTEAERAANGWLSDPERGN